MLPSENARKIFHIRSGTVDLKCYRRYKYGEDRLCRLCNEEDENVEHVVNNCPSVSRQYRIDDIFTQNIDDLLEISKRCILFDQLAEEMDELENEMRCEQSQNG